MQSVIALLLVAALGDASSVALGSQTRQRTKVNPIQKVLAMMNDMLEKAKTEKGDEAAAFAQFQQLCTSQRGEKERSTADAKASIEKLGADGEKAVADAANLAKDIAELSTETDQFQADMRRANQLRTKGKADYQAEHEEYSASITATEKAALTIQSGGAASSFAQTSLLELSSRTHVQSSARRTILSFLQRPESEVSMLQNSILQASAAPEAKAFESSSGGILEMVHQLGDKFQEERAQLEKEEKQEVYNHQMAIQELTNQVDAATRAQDMKMSQKAQKEQAKSEADGEISNTQSTLDADTKFLSDTNAECAQKSSNFEKQQVLRAGEITAITKAIEIMSSDEVAGSGEKHLPSMVQETQDASSLAQLRSGSGSSAARSELSARAQSRQQRQSKVAAFLKNRARQMRSRVLSLISLRVTSDPFKKVTKMIKDMIFKLMEEANEEAEHKGFCDKEMGANKLTRDAKSDESEMLHAQIEELGAAVSKLSEETADLSSAVADLDAALSEATKLRQAEKEKNTKTVAEAKAGQQAVANAVAVLREFYEKAAFVQTSSGDSSSGDDPSFFPSNFAKRANALIQAEASGQDQDSTEDAAPGTQDSSGVVGMLEVIESDFSRLETETKAAEGDAARVYREFKNDTEQDKDVKNTDLDFKEDAKQQKTSALNQAQHDLKGTLAELDAAMKYFQELKPSCVDAEVSQEDRVAQRKDEIESLKEALNILSE